MTYERTRFATALGRLPPGTYQVRVRFWPVPYQPSASTFFSPSAEITVGKFGAVEQT